MRGRKISPKLPIFLISSLFEDFAFPYKFWPYWNFTFRNWICLSFLRLFYCKGERFEVWCTRRTMDRCGKRWKIGKFTRIATDTQLPSMRVCGDECIISTPIIFYRWNETLHVEDIYPMPQLPHLHLFQDKCALQRQFPANSNFAGFFPTFQYKGTICLASRVHLDSDLISEKTGRLPSWQILWKFLLTLCNILTFLGWGCGGSEGGEYGG